MLLLLNSLPCSESSTLSRFSHFKIHGKVPNWDEKSRFVIHNSSRVTILTYQLLTVKYAITQKILFLWLLKWIISTKRTLVTCDTESQLSIFSFLCCFFSSLRVVSYFSWVKIVVCEKRGERDELRRLFFINYNIYNSNHGDIAAFKQFFYSFTHSISTVNSQQYCVGENSSRSHRFLYKTKKLNESCIKLNCSIIWRMEKTAVRFEIILKIFLAKA